MGHANSHAVCKRPYALPACNACALTHSPAVESSAWALKARGVAAAAPRPLRSARAAQVARVGTWDSAGGVQGSGSGQWMKAGRSSQLRRSACWDALAWPRRLLEERIAASVRRTLPQALLAASILRFVNALLLDPIFERDWICMLPLIKAAAAGGNAYLRFSVAGKCVASVRPSGLRPTSTAVGSSVASRTNSMQVIHSQAIQGECCCPSM